MIAQLVGFLLWSEFCYWYGVYMGMRDGRRRD